MFKDIFYLELWQPLCLVEWNHLCNFGSGHHVEQFCEIILKSGSGHVVLKIFLSRALAGILFSGAKLFVQFW